MTRLVSPPAKHAIIATLTFVCGCAIAVLAALAFIGVNILA